MNGPLSTVRGVSMRRGLRVVLGLQALIAVALIASDIDPRWVPRFGNDPALPTGPVTPGDQVRRYEPNRPSPGITRPANLPDGVEFPDDLPPRLEFTVETGDARSVVLINGPITPGDAERFEAFLAAEGGLTLPVVINSPGGAVAEALTIGRALREAEARTIILPGAICLSACPYMFAGGVDREVSRRGAVGMHQSYYDAPGYLPAFLAVEDIQHAQGRTMQYLVDMGVSPGVMLYSLNTPPDEIYILVEEELTETGLATEITD
ncbi:hypothetical protein HKCCE2091_08895 [Rhodobacterales bacterium HKCCE2091]|nr:hypothetical protein [Rhodobacterales bacterium HKCCE2091]